MDTKKRQNMYLPIILFLFIGSIFVGTSALTEGPKMNYINNECEDYQSDNDNDGYSGIIEDIECQSYPYSDGNGESPTSSQDQGKNAPYQNYFDLSVDFTRYFIDKQCNNNLQNCIGTNFITEVEFYCWFSDNVMASSWDLIFNAVFNQIGNLPDDGSITTYQNTCQVFGGPPANMPNNGDQQSSPIADNPNGQSNGGMNGGGPK